MPTVASSHPGLGENFRLGGWLVQPKLNRLSDDRRTVQLEPRAMDVLAYLSRHAGRVVPRQEILDAVWQRKFVADATLSHAVTELRRALGDSAQQPRFIETISKRGYRVVAPVHPAAPERAGAQVAAERLGGTEPLASALPSVAVLPFVDMSAAGDQEYFCDGVAEELTNALAQLDGLNVAARTSAFAFKGKLADVREIGRRLGVEAVLEGSVRKVGDRLRISVQLVNVVDGLHLWSERFDRTDEDIFAIQDEISLGVVDRLRVRLPAGKASLLGRRSTASREAYDLYLRGRHLLSRRRASELQRAVEYLEKAIAADPSYALPHVAIAETFGILGLWGFLPPATALGRAKAAAFRAVAIDDSLAEAHAWLATVLFFKDRDWERGNHHFERALRLPRPSSVAAFGFGIYHLVGRRSREVAEVASRLVATEPLSSIAHTQAASLLIGIGDFDHAVTLLEEALELDPELPMAQLWMGFILTAIGRLEEACDMFRRAASDGLAAAMLGLPAVLVRTGQREAAKAAVAVMERTARERYVSPLIRAVAWAALGDRERSLAFLALAEEERSPMLTMMLFGAGYMALLPQWMVQWVTDLHRRLFGGEATALPAPAEADGR